VRAIAGDSAVSDTLVVKIDTTAAKASLDALKTSVSTLSTSLTNIDKKNEAFDRLVKALSGLNTTGISSLAGAFGQLSQTASQASTAATQVANAARQANSTTQQAAGSATQWANNLKNVAAAAATGASGMNTFQTGLAGIGAALARTGGGLAAATGQFGQLGVAIQTGMSNFNMLTGLKFSPAFAAGLAGATAAVVAMIAVLPALASAVVQVNNEFVSFRNAMDAIRGSGAGADAFKQLQGVAARTATDFRTLSKSFVGFEAAAKQMGMTTSQSVKMFEQLSGAMRVLGVEGVKSERVLMAFQQMASKGKIQMEELKQQMGEAMPTAIKAMANALGVSVEQMTKMLELGQVSSAILPKFTDELLKLSGGASAVERATKTMGAQLTMLTNNFNLLLDAFGKGLNFSFVDSIAAGLSRINAALGGANFQVFAAGIGELVGVLGGAFLSALGTALQILSPFAAAIGLVASGFATAVGVVTSAVAAFAQLTGLNSFIQGISNGMSAFVAILSAAYDSIQTLVGWFSKMWTEATKSGTALGALAAVVGALATGFQTLANIFGQATGFVAAMAASYYLAVKAVGLLVAAKTALMARINGVQVALVAATAQKTALATASTVAAGAVSRLAVAMRALSSIGVIGVFTALVGIFGALYTGSETFKNSIDSMSASFTNWIASFSNAKQETQTLKQYMDGLVPSMASVKQALDQTYNSLSSQADLLLRAQEGWLGYASSGDAVADSLKNIDKAMRDNNNALAGVQARQDMAKIAGKEFTTGIDSQIQYLNRQKQSLGEVGMATDLYDSRIRRLTEAKQASALADADADARAQRERESIQSANQAMEEKKQKFNELAAAQKLYGVALDESGIKEAEELTRLGLKANVAGQVVAANALMTQGVDGFKRALEEETQQLERSRDQLVNRYNAMLKYAEAMPQNTQLEIAMKKSIMGSVGALGEHIKSINQRIIAQKVLAEAGKEQTSVDEALKNEYNNLTEAMKTHYGSYQDFQKAINENIQKEVEQQTGIKKTAETAAESAGTVKTAYDGLGTVFSTVGNFLTGLWDNFGKGGEDVAQTTAKVDQAKTSFDSLNPTLATLRGSVEGVGAAYTVFADANTRLTETLPIVNPALQTMNETLTTALPTFQALGVASTQVGAGFGQWSESLPVIAGGITGLQETLPPFVASITSLAGALQQIDESSQGVRNMVDAIGEVLPKLEEMGTALNAVTASTNQSADAFGTKFVNAYVEGAPKAASAVDAMASSMVRAINDIIAAVERAIQALKDLAAAQASTGGGGGGGGSTDVPAQRYGGYAGVSKETQSSPVSAFASAPQFAQGTDNTNKFMKKLPGGGIPSILHPNEAVVPLPKGGSIPVQFTGGGIGEQSAGLASAIRNLAEEIKPRTMNTPPPDLYVSDKIDGATRASNVTAPSRGRVNDAGQGEPAINVTMNITTPDADSFKRSQPQIKADAYRTMREAYNRNK